MAMEGKRTAFWGRVGMALQHNKHASQREFFMNQLMLADANVWENYIVNGPRAGSLRPFVLIHVRRF